MFAIKTVRKAKAITNKRNNCMNTSQINKGRNETNGNLTKPQKMGNCKSRNQQCKISFKIQRLSSWIKN